MCWGRIAHDGRVSLVGSCLNKTVRLPWLSLEQPLGPRERPAIPAWLGLFERDAFEVLDFGARLAALAIRVSGRPFWMSKIQTLRPKVIY